MAVDHAKLEELVGRVGADGAAAMHGATVVLGHHLGLYRALADGGPQRAEDLAATTGCHPRLVQEWLNAQVASDYCGYDPAAGRYWLTPEQVACLADESSPAFMLGSMLAASAVHRDEPLVRRVFQGDGRLGWHEHNRDLFPATERSFRTMYETELATTWVSALDGVAERLRAGGRVADIGCGFGTAIIQLARAFPAAAFSGFDSHPPSVDAARKAASEAGVSDRVTFEVAGADAFPGGGYDLICMLNAIHEMGDPVTVAAHVRTALADGGSLMLLEPLASDQVEENRTTVGRTFYSVSTMVCVPSALSQGAAPALGAQAGETALREVATRAGFSTFRRVAETPMSMVLEAKP